MRKSLFLTMALGSMLQLGALAAEPRQVVPTTTLQAETGNNSSTADSFPGTSNGNPGAGNVSKMPVRDLVYGGSDTKMLVATMGWFGKASHISVGYTSSDPAQVHKQITDMKSRGFDGLSLAWYGSSETEQSNMTAKQIMREAEAQGGFVFALRPNEGIIKWYSNGQTPTDALIRHLTYASSTFFASPAYLRVNGRPVLFEFGLSSYGIDWNRVRAEVPGNPLIIFRNPGG